MFVTGVVNSTALLIPIIHKNGKTILYLLLLRVILLFLSMLLIHFLPTLHSFDLYLTFRINSFIFLFSDFNFAIAISVSVIDGPSGFFSFLSFFLNNLELRILETVFPNPFFNFGTKLILLTNNLLHNNFLQNS